MHCQPNPGPLFALAHLNQQPGRQGVPGSHAFEATTGKQCSATPCPQGPPTTLRNTNSLDDPHRFGDHEDCLGDGPGYTSESFPPAPLGALRRRTQEQTEEFLKFLYIVSLGERTFIPLSSKLTTPGMR